MEPECLKNHCDITDKLIDFHREHGLAKTCRLDRSGKGPRPHQEGNSPHV